MSPALTYQMAPLSMACLPSGICFDKSKHQGYVIFPAKYNTQFILLATYAFLSHAKKDSTVAIACILVTGYKLPRTNQSAFSDPQNNFEGGTRDTWKSLNKLRCHPGDLWVAVSGGSRGFYMHHILSYSMCSCLWTPKISRSLYLFSFLQKILIFKVICIH